MKPVDGKSNTYIESSKQIDNKDPELEIGDFVRISKYKNIFAKDYALNWSEEVFVIKKVKNTVPLNISNVLWKTISKNKSKRI